MCMDGGSDASKEMRRQEEERQAEIEAGMAQINAVFQGGTYGINPVTEKPSAGGAYFDAQGRPWQFDPNDLDFREWRRASGGPVQSLFDLRRLGETDEEYAARQATEGTAMQRSYMEYLARQGRLFGGTQTGTGFNDEFYNKRAKAFEEFALPQLARQQDTTSRQLSYSMANRGLLGSSAGRVMNSSLMREAGTQRQNIANEGRSQANTLRSDIEQQRQNLVGQLMTASEPLTIAQQAVGTAAQFNAPSSMPAVGDLFSNWANINLAGRLNNAYSNPTGGAANVPWFGRLLSPGGTTQRIIP